MPNILRLQMSTCTYVQYCMYVCTYVTYVKNPGTGMCLPYTIEHVCTYEGPCCLLRIYYLYHSCLGLSVLGTYACLYALWSQFCTCVCSIIEYIGPNFVRRANMLHPPNTDYTQSAKSFHFPLSASMNFLVHWTYVQHYNLDKCLTQIVAEK